MLAVLDDEERSKMTVLGVVLAPSVVVVLVTG